MNETCSDFVRGFGSARAVKCGLVAFAVVSVDGFEGERPYCVEHLAANITGHVTESGEVRVTKVKVSR